MGVEVSSGAPVIDGYQGATLVIGPNRRLASIKGMQKF